MTPFDPSALLVMLRAFYPTVSVPALEQARRDRPEYFAGGVLFGTYGEKLRLPDGRVFDLIFDVDGPASRWQVIDVTHPGPDPDDPFPLQPGPLTPIDETQWPRPSPTPAFAASLAAHLAWLGIADAPLGRAQDTIAEASSPAAFEAAFAGTIEPAGGMVWAQRAALVHAEIADVYAATLDQGTWIDARDNELDVAVPGPMQPIDPGAPPWHGPRPEPRLPEP